MKRIKRHHLKRFSAGYISTGQAPIPRRDRTLFGVSAGTIDYRYAKLFKVDDPRPIVKVMQPAQDPDKHICLFSRMYTKLFLFWNTEYTQFYFVKHVCNLILVSITYPSRDVALRAHRLNRITWIESSGGSEPHPIA